MRPKLAKLNSMAQKFRHFSYFQSFESMCSLLSRIIPFRNYLPKECVSSSTNCTGVKCTGILDLDGTYLSFPSQFNRFVRVSRHVSDFHKHNKPFGITTEFLKRTLNPGFLTGIHDINCHRFDLLNLVQPSRNLGAKASLLESNPFQNGVKAIFYSPYS